MKSWIVSLCALAIASLFAQAQQDFSKVVIKTIPVAGNIYMLEGAGGNIGVSVGPDGVLMVDDQFAPLAEKIETAVKKLNPGPLKFVLNTHWHGDHTGGNAHFGRNASIMAHQNVRKRLAGKSDTAKEALPVVTYEDGISVHFNGEEIRVRSVPPGHTDGDSIVQFTQSKVVHLGDQFFNGRFPFIDLNSGGSVNGYIKNVENALKTIPEDWKIIPGHGSLATRKDLEQFHQMLVETSALVRKAVEEGKTLEQVKAAGVPEKYKAYAWQFISTERWLETLYKGARS